MTKIIPGHAKILTENHTAVLDGLADAAKESEHIKNEVREASRGVIARELMEVLRGIPVSELSREIPGLRVKTLTDAGYSSAAELITAPTAALTALNGISEDRAKEIKAAANEIAKQARDGIRVRLSADDTSDDMRRLIRALYVHRHAKTVFEVCRTIDGLYRPQALPALQALIPAETTVGWMRASDEQKARAEEAWDTLVALQKTELFEDAKKAVHLLPKLRQVNDKMATDDFTAFTAEYAVLFEELLPELAAGDELYGLPGELAEQVRSEVFFPEGLKCTLRRYQEWGVKYILHQENVLLGDEMGLGKTVQAIAAMVSLRNTGQTHFFVVCPASVLENWCRELEKHSTLHPVKIYGSKRDAALEDWIENGGVAVTNYETTDNLTLPEDFRYAMLTVDEAHYIKNPEALRTRSVAKLAESTGRRLFMTGTALENRVDEMTVLLDMLQPEVAAKARSLQTLAKSEQFREAVAPAYYRRKRADVLTELPDKTETKEWCPLEHREEKAAYADAVMRKDFADARRVSWSVEDPEFSSKACRMKEIIDEAAEDGRKVIVFSFFLDTIAKAAAMLGDAGTEPITGSVPPERRQEIIDEFDEAPAGKVLLAQIISGGTGLNIQSASVVIIAEPQLKPSTENQAISRAYRMGQSRNVLVYRLLCPGTVDERITELLAEKQHIFDEFADDSVAAEKDLELDKKEQADILEKEEERLRKEAGIEETPADHPESRPDAPSENVKNPSNVT